MSSCSTSACPRCRSTDPSAASRTQSTRRSTCAWIRAQAHRPSDVVNELGERELADIFKRYGEERYARPIARAIAKRRREQRFERTGDLVDVIKAAIPAPARFGEGHPAKRVFQALRIEVNDELGAVERALAGGARDASFRRASRRDLVPLARRPARQAVLAPRGAGLHLPAGLPGLRVRLGAHDPGDAAARDPADRGGNRAQPACAVGAPPRGDEGLSGRRYANHSRVRASPVLRRPGRHAPAAGSSGSRSAGFCSQASYS